MADRANEAMAERESSALSKLQAAAGIVDKPQVERLDWMYEQSAAQMKKSDDELMNMPVSGQVDKDMEDMKDLQENTAGSLFLRSATRTSEDMLRKLREDPLFQIKRAEVASKQSLMQNPLVQARLKKKEDKLSKKEAKKEKKRAKKEKKAMKKLAKKEKKALKNAVKKESSSSSSSDSDGGGDGPPASKGNASRRPTSPVQQRRDRSPARRDRSPRGGASAVKRRSRSRSRRRSRSRSPDLSALGPSHTMVSKREEHAALIARRKDSALASRGLSGRLDEEEKKRRYDQMKADAATHERSKETRIANAEKRSKEIEELEDKMRKTSDQGYFREMRQSTYMEGGANLGDRMKNQRHRRQKHLNDPLEKDQ